MIASHNALKKSMTIMMYYFWSCLQKLVKQSVIAKTVIKCYMKKQKKIQRVCRQ